MEDQLAQSQQTLEPDLERSSEGVTFYSGWAVYSRSAVEPLAEAEIANVAATALQVEESLAGTEDRVRISEVDMG